MISRGEYADRQQRFAAALRGAGLDGALVVSRGGATADRYGDVLYLSGHYQHYSYLPDAPGLFSARAHTAVAISARGDAVLCVSVPEFDRTRLAVDDIRHGPRFVETVAQALADLGLAGRTLALVGADVLPANQWQALRLIAPEITWREEDELLAKLRRVKSATEQALVREAARIHRQATTRLIERLRPGVTEAEAMAAFVAEATSAGAGIYFTTMSSGEATAMWASTPQPGFSRRALATGDLVRFDTGIVVAGYLSDFGRAVTIGPPGEGQRHLLQTLHGGLDAAIAAVRPGASVRAVVAAGEAALADAGVRPAGQAGDGIASSFPVHWGHGLGLGWERPWMTEAEELTIVPGMVLAIERALTLPGVGTAAAEQNLLVGTDGVALLTAGPDGRWS
ncbi:MAG TPA: Xaa-Pro peptidase family protein [Acetobacteraceae bacterium]|nr:Xaa-Pro peptidase family protein [Acetobacteraceae bacterium]